MHKSSAISSASASGSRVQHDIPFSRITALNEAPSPPQQQQQQQQQQQRKQRRRRRNKNLRNNENAAAKVSRGNICVGKRTKYDREAKNPLEILSMKPQQQILQKQQQHAKPYILVPNTDNNDTTFWYLVDDE